MKPGDLIAASIQVGPFGFVFLPDGDDQGVGAVVLDTGEEIGAQSQTPFTVPRETWDEFVETVERGSR